MPAIPRIPMETEKIRSSGAHLFFILYIVVSSLFIRIISLKRWVSSFIIFIFSIIVIFSLVLFSVDLQRQRHCPVPFGNDHDDATVE